ncbi:hypothetical protein F511_42891 [Dorcoceras hygrometricum]|uniref:Uncharacterized protein n=1 Tax=Dorcoceras hygrometricum TaxID=472368 RepID=A0A2Z7D210_9LAMI|nr:hypothetical protein F511_42891 [Dorcoceras hygrometricum]
MMKTLRERRADPEGASRSLHPSKGKKKASEGQERRKKHRHEEKTKESARATVSKCPISKPRGTTGKALEQQSTEAPYVLLDTSAISFVAKPSGSVSLDFVRRLVPDQDFDLVKSVPNLAALEAASLHFMQVPGQFRDNGYSEEEHHALFLDVEKALADMPEDEDSEEGSSGREEAPTA